MNDLTIFMTLVLASVLAAPTYAETYGDGEPDTPNRPNNVKTVPRPTPAAALPAATSPVAPTVAPTPAATADVEVKRVWDAQLASETQALAANRATSGSQCEFKIQASDDTLETALRRWSQASGWQSPQWNFRTVYVDYRADFCGDGGFEGAVDRLMAAENAAGIPLFATYHTNNVVVIDGGK